MATTFLFVLILVIPLITAQMMPFDPVPDPGCVSGRGLPAGNACCPAACNVCGGFGCEMRPAGSFCCTGVVIRTMRSCNVVGPPCAINPPVASPSTSPAFKPSPKPSAMPQPPPMQEMPKGTPIWKDITASIGGMQIRRADACFVMVQGKGYLLGGRGGRRKTNIFNPKTRMWTTGAAPPVEFHHGSCVAFKFKVIVATSWTGPFPNETQNEDILVYDVPRDVWTTRPGLPEKRRRAAAGAVLFKNRIWVVGGARDGHGVGSTTVGFFDSYDLKKLTWNTGLPNLPIARSHTGAAIVGGRLCVAGGRNGSVKNFYSAVIASTFCYDMVKRVWINVKAPMPMARADGAYGRTCDGKMIVAGGGVGALAALKRVDLFDGTSWSRGPDLVTGRHGTGLAVAGCSRCDQIFIAAGQGGREARRKLGRTEVFLPNGVDRICARY